jgi:hypothetical protein
MIILRGIYETKKAEAEEKEKKETVPMPGIKRPRKAHARRPRKH